MINLKRKNNEQGFTLIELLVAMAVFMVIIVAVIDIFAVGLGGSQRIFGRQNTQDSARFILESMSKEIRMSKINTADGQSNTLNITNSKGQTLNYVFDNVNKQITRGGAVLNSSNVEITGTFYVQKSGNLPPRVTPVLKVVNKTGQTAQRVVMNLQTTISSRRYDQ